MALLLWMACTGWASAEQASQTSPQTTPQTTSAAGPETAEQASQAGEDPPVFDRCNEPGSDQSEWIDRVQRAVYMGVCGPISWFDSLFGTPRNQQDVPGTYGRIGISPYWDRRNGFKIGLRMRGRIELPALEDRLQLLIGRGEGQAMIDGRDQDTETPFPASFRSLVRDEAWLVGLGYSSSGAHNNRLSISSGIRLRSPLDPYVNVTYRHDFVLDARSVLRLRETVFWRQSRGFGFTTEFTLDRLVMPNTMLRWENSATIAGDTLGWEWLSQVRWFHALNPRTALAFSLFLEGDTGGAVPVSNYGVETLFRRQVARPWLFLQVRAGLSWPKDTPAESRLPNPGIGIGFEMYFGPVPERELH